MSCHIIACPRQADRRKKNFSTTVNLVHGQALRRLEIGRWQKKIHALDDDFIDVADVTPTFLNILCSALKISSWAWKLHCVSGCQMYCDTVIGWSLQLSQFSPLYILEVCCCWLTRFCLLILTRKLSVLAQFGVSRIPMSSDLECLTKINWVNLWMHEKAISTSAGQLYFFNPYNSFTYGSDPANSVKFQDMGVIRWNVWGWRGNFWERENIQLAQLEATLTIKILTAHRFEPRNTHFRIISFL